MTTDAPSITIAHVAALRTAAQLWPYPTVISAKLLEEAADFLLHHIAESPVGQCSCLGGCNCLPDDEELEV